MKKELVILLAIIISLSFVSADSIDNIINQAIANPVSAEEITLGIPQINAINVNDSTALLENETAVQGIVVQTAKTARVKSVKTADLETAVKNKAVKDKGLKKYFSDREKANKANEKIKAAKISAKKAADETKKTTSKAKTSTRIRSVFKTTGKVISDAFDSVSSRVSRITGNIVKSYEYSDLELPSAPSSPGETREVTKPKSGFARIFNFLTGNAIIGIPDWSYDGSQPGNYIWTADYTSQAGSLQHFELKLDVNMLGNVNGIVYGKGYYLDEKKARWEQFDFSGTSVGSTGWIRESAIASMTLNNFTDNDYAIFLAYSCSKKMQQAWDCNQGKWVIFVVGTGNVSYNQDIGETPTMNYTEVKNLNVSDIPSVLKQLGISALDFQPIMHDASLVAVKTDFITNVNQTEKLEFYVKNIGNRDLTNLSFELDVGERALAEVVAAEIPDIIKINETVKASVSLLFKEAGNWKFPLFLKPKQEEVDTSDNIIRFSVNVSGEIKPNMPQDSLINAWNRQIRYTVKEEYSREEYARNSSLVIISGTNKMRTVFGGYYQGRSTNPTMKVYLKPLVTEEAIFSTPYVASIFIGGKMLTGDREVVNYYVVLKNEKTGKTYTTPLMESMYKYYYNPKELIPDFEFCVNYSAKVVLTTQTSETIDIIEPQGFNLCDFSKDIGELVRTQRLLKLDGNYIAVSFNLDEKYFEPNQVISYKIEFTDSSKRKYYTRAINSSEGVVLLKIGDVIPRGVNFYSGEVLNGTVILLDSIQARGGSPAQFAPRNSALHFVWNSWNITASLETKLILRDEKIRMGFEMSLRASSSLGESSSYSPLWRTKLSFYGYPEFPYYFDSSVKQKIKSETEWIFSIKDLNENNNVYELDIDCSNVSPIYPSEASQYSREHNSWLFCYVDGGMTLDSMNQIQALPEFINGHHYEFSLKVISDNADLYAPINPVKILYIDGYQFVANTPLLRTRFLYLENHPASVRVAGSPTREYTPQVYISYLTRNLFFNETSNRIDFIDTSQREIKLYDLISVGASWNSDKRYDYQQKQGSTKPIFSGFQITIAPLSDTLQIKRTQFNCKLGRYDLVCQRSASGYSITYVDEVNNFVYNINLGSRDSLFIKKYRDNPRVYDAVVYDILSEIDRNPITNLIPSQTIEKRFPNVQLITAGNQVAFKGLNGFFGEELYYGSNSSLKYEANCLYNQTSRDIYGDYPVIDGFHALSSGLEEHSTKRANSPGNYSLKIFKDGSLIFSEKINVLGYSGNDFRMALSKLVNSINLTNNEVYGFEIAPENKVDWIYSFANPVKYKTNYEKEVIEDNANYIRKIPELNSTIMGPYDFASESSYGPLYPCAQEAYSNASAYQLLSGFSSSSLVPNYRYLSPLLDFPKNNDIFVLFSVNPPAVKNFYSGEATSLEEFRNNTRGERRLLLDSNRFYAFSVMKFDDIYEYYKSAPVQYTSLDTNTTGISCWSMNRQLSYPPEAVSSSKTVFCKFANINDLKVYQLEISQIFPGKTEADLSNLDTVTGQSFSDYTETVLRKYVQWYPPTPLLNTNFFSY